MESLGRKLAEARETHHYSLEQVSRDTHISKQYLRALEEEDFSAIPGETYIIGFLRNYAEYLALNPEEMVTLYKNMKIQEQPLPMAELLEKHPQRPRSLGLVLLLAAIIILGGGGYLAYRLIFSGRSPAPARTPEGAPAAAANSLPEKEAYVLQEEVLTRWFSLDDVIQVPVNGRQYPLQLTNIGETLTVQVPGASLELTVGQERLLDFNNDAKFDVRLLLNDLDAAGEIKRANLGFYKMTRGAMAAAEQAAGEEAAESAAAEAETEAAAAPGAAEAAGQEAESEAPPSPLAAVPVSGLAILQSPTPEPFRVTANFRGYCLFRYVLNGEREERFFHKGESFSLDVKQRLNVWLSNAGALKMMIAGRDVDLGKPGEVAAKQIGWVKEEGSDQYSLRVSTLD